MKKIAVILFTLLVSTVYSQAIDSLKVIEIPESYANRLGEPLIVKKDSLYKFKTSDIYLVNKKSFVAIKNVYQTTINKDQMTQELVEKYTQTLRENIDLERKLAINFTESDSLDQVVYQKTQTTLGHTQKALDFTINSLEKASTSLDLVEKMNKKQKRKTIFEKILMALAGVGAGILVGVTL